MSGAASEITQGMDDYAKLGVGSHIAYIFKSSAEKQTRLFNIARDALSVQSCFLLYVAGKQGVKGIRLSLKDAGFDVAGYERAKRIRIVDSEEWFLRSNKQPSFKPNEEIISQYSRLFSEVQATGCSHLTIISETDMLVRKGFYGHYKELDRALGRQIGAIKAILICAFDERELLAASISKPADELLEFHSSLII